MAELITIQDTTGKSRKIRINDAGEIITKALLAYVDEDGDQQDIALQNPLPVNGDRVYVKDINQDLCDNGDFTNGITDYFEDWTSTNINTTSDNPKIIKIVLNSPIQCSDILFGCFDTNYNYSNVKIKLLGPGDVILYTVDDTANDTKYNARTSYAFPPEPLIAMQVEFHTSDPVGLTDIVLWKSQNRISRIQAQSSLTSEVENITCYRQALDVNPAYRYRKSINQYFHRETGVSTTVAIASEIGDYSITVASAVGFNVNDYAKLIDIQDGYGIEEIGILKITDVTGNVISFDRPLGYAYTTAATLKVVDIEMAVLGTLANPVIYEIVPPLNTVWQLTQHNIALVDNLECDDSKFGGIPALTNGVVLRAKTEAGRVAITANWKNNKDIKLDAGSIDYSDKAGGGSYGAGAVWELTKNEFVGEVDGADSTQKIEMLIQDDLRDLISYQQKMQGRVFSP